MGTKSTKPITQPQLRKIYAEAREAGLDKLCYLKQRYFEVSALLFPHKSNP